MHVSHDKIRQFNTTLSRRDLLIGAGALAAAAATPARAGAADVIKIGYVSPRSGGMASVVATDGFVLDQARAALKSGLAVGGKTYEVQILDRDSQSDPKRAGELAKALIAQDGVDFMLASYTPETIHPVADACEAAGVPGVFNVCPWQAFYFGRGAKPGQPSPFKWTYLFSFGLETFGKSFMSQWSQLPTNKKVGVMYPGDIDGAALRNAMIPILQNGGFTVVDPGPFPDGSSDYTTQIALFQKEQCEIVNSFMVTQDSPVFLRQAALAGLTKQIKACSVIKSGIVPSDIAAMGSLGHKLLSSGYWHRTLPYASPLTGQTSAALADAYEKATGAQAMSQLGAGLALFDVATEAFKASGAPKDKAAVTKTIAALDVVTVNGRVDFRSGPVPNVAVMPDFGVQYMKAKKGPFKLDCLLVDNVCDSNVPLQAKVVPYNA